MVRIVSHFLSLRAHFPTPVGRLHGGIDTNDRQCHGLETGIDERRARSCERRSGRAHVIDDQHARPLREVSVASASHAERAEGIASSRFPIKPPLCTTPGVGGLEQVERGAAQRLAQSTRESLGQVATTSRASTPIGRHPRHGIAVGHERGAITCHEVREQAAAGAPVPALGTADDATDRPLVAERCQLHWRNRDERVQAGRAQR